VQVVLGGDPKQLGPMIHSPAARKHGLSTSLLERLLSRPMYAKSTTGMHLDSNGYDPGYITMLVRNYRSHALLLQVPNMLFYDGVLEAWADCMITDCRLHWEGLPASGVPLLWHGVEGKEEREADSPSWFNRDEAVSVLKHVSSLMRMRPCCRQENIGVITPYNKQAQKIRRLLKMNDMGDIKVGSTEMFQGQERQVIIISAVRSSLSFIGFDVQHSIGFLDNPKRFNVAGTASKHVFTPIRYC
jgi:helicase MOV-10